jgi:hypothetical protein
MTIKVIQVDSAAVRSGKTFEVDNETDGYVIWSAVVNADWFDNKKSYVVENDLGNKLDCDAYGFAWEKEPPEAV